MTKTIHQRNKSSPALTTLNLNQIRKRAAFGDVSNISNVPVPKRVSKDDSSVNSKSTSSAITKGSQLQERKSANFLRPAQRPLSVSTLKQFLSGSSAETTSKIPLNDGPTTTQQPVHSRKTLSKRSTTIFKDVSLNAVPENEAVAQEFPKVILPETADKVESSTLSTIAEIDVTRLDTGLYLPPPASSDRIDILKFPTPSELNLPEIYEVNLDTQLPSEIKTEEQVKNEQDTYITEVPDLIDEPSNKTQYVDALPNQPKPADDPSLEKSEPMGNIASTDLPQFQEPTPDPEEYWEEEYEDAYEGDGYVTARSFRSRGDDTTGGATTILEPKFNHKVRKELAEAKVIVEATRTQDEIEDENFDTSMVAEYGDEIFAYMRHQEEKMLPRANYMNDQHEIQWSMRAVLMDWLVQVHHRFNLLPETLFLCVNYIDRFLSVKVVSLGKLQLVGATAIFIAAKYEEINCPSVQEIVYMVDGGYSVEEILKAERFMLTMLQFELGFPGPMSFLRRISKADDYDLETRTLAKYFLEVTLMDERFIGSVPSFLSAASHCLARMMLRKGDWSPHHVHYSGYTWFQLKPAVQLLLECCDDPRKHHQAVFNKYCDKRYKRASAFVETELQRGFELPDVAPWRSAVQQSYQTSYYYTAQSACYA